jgi:ATP-dependent helicase IRC3
MAICNLIKPREYQLEALEAVTSNSAKRITRQLICLPTGTGKTVVFALLAKEINRRTLVIAHTEELIKQAVEKFKIVWPEVDIGIVKAEADEVDSHVVVASIQTICREKRLEKLKEQNFGLIIIDEAHHAGAPSYENTIRELGFLDDNPEKLLVGVTATAKRGDGIGLSSIFQEIVFERSINTMIRAGYLSPLVGKQVFTKIDLTGVSFQNGDFMQAELAKVVNTPSRNQLIVDNYKLNAANRKKALAFCVDVQHAKDLATTFERSGVNAYAVYGAMDKQERKKLLSAFSNGSFSVLTNCQILTEGFDEPSIDCVILGRPTASSSLFTQMIGRGTRTFPTKRDCLVLDFTDNATRHNLCTSNNTLKGAVTSLDHFGEAIVEEMSEVMPQDKIIDSKSFYAIRVMEEKIEKIEFFDKTAFAWTPIGSDWL